MDIWMIKFLKKNNKMGKRHSQGEKSPEPQMLMASTLLSGSFFVF